MLTPFPDGAIAEERYELFYVIMEARSLALATKKNRTAARLIMDGVYMIGIGLSHGSRIPIPP